MKNMKIGQGLASIGLFTLGVFMLHYEMNACGMGLIIIFGLAWIWSSSYE